MSENLSHAGLGDGDKKHRRPLFILGGLLLLLLGALAYMFLYYDGPPPDDAHLLPTWSERGGNANPLAVLCKTLVGSSIEEWEKQPYELRDLDKTPTSEARKFVAAHAAEIAAFESLMRTDPGSWQWPDAAGLAKYNARYSDSGASECRTLSFVLRSKALQLSEEGRVEEAIALCLKMARWGDGMYGAEGRTLHLLFSGTVHYGALHTLRKVLQDDEVTPTILWGVLLQLRALKGPQTEQYIKALKVDYALIKDSTAKFSNKDLQYVANLPRALRFVTPGYFKRNQTLTSRVQLDTQLISALDKDWKSACAAMDARKAKVDDMYGPKSQACFMDPNFIGKSFVFYVTGLPRSGHHWSLRDELILQLALRLHELEHGYLPATLDALVPAYLPSVPLDVISGTPFLWNAKQQVLYTVGENGKDDGGSINKKRFERGLDWGMKYPWSPAGSIEPVAHE